VKLQKSARCCSQVAKSRQGQISGSKAFPSNTGHKLSKKQLNDVFQEDLLRIIHHRPKCMSSMLSPQECCFRCLNSRTSTHPRMIQGRWMENEMKKIASKLFVHLIYKKNMCSHEQFSPNLKRLDLFLLLVLLWKEIKENRKKMNEKDMLRNIGCSWLLLVFSNISTPTLVGRLGWN
jgi:hypothetical protein